MEGLIFALIIMALGAFFNGKKKEDKELPDPVKRVQGSAAERGQRTFKRVEDYAKNVYGELQGQMNENPQRTKQVSEKADKMMERLPARERERAKQAAERGRQAIEKMPRKEPERPPRAQPYSAGRLTAHQEIGAAARAAETPADESFSLRPDEMKKAIILAEILMPPKSKR